VSFASSLPFRAEFGCTCTCDPPPQTYRYFVHAHQLASHVCFWLFFCCVSATLHPTPHLHAEPDTSSPSLISSTRVCVCCVGVPAPFFDPPFVTLPVQGGQTFHSPKGPGNICWFSCFRLPPARLPSKHVSWSPPFLRVWSRVAFICLFPIFARFLLPLWSTDFVLFPSSAMTTGPEV